MGISIRGVVPFSLGIVFVLFASNPGAAGAAEPLSDGQRVVDAASSKGTGTGDQANAKAARDDSSDELANFNADAIVSGKATTVGLVGRRVEPVDCDGDGEDEFVSFDGKGDIVVISADGSVGRTFNLQQIPSGSSLVSARPFRVGSETRWATVFSSYAQGWDPRGELVIYDDDGRQLWSYKPQLPDRRLSEMKVAVGDLNGDGKVELVVLLTQFTQTPSGKRSFTRHDFSSALTLLDVEGKELARRQVQGHATNLTITKPSGSKAQAAILWFGDEGVQRFFFDPSAVHNNTP